MKIGEKKNNILECLSLESEEELHTFQTKRLLYWDDFEHIINNFTDGIVNKHTANYIDIFEEEMSSHAKTAKNLNAGLKDEERILKY